MKEKFTNMASYIQHVADNFLSETIFNLASHIIASNTTNDKLDEMNFKNGVYALQDYCLNLAVSPLTNHDNLCRSFLDGLNHLYKVYQSEKNFAAAKIVTSTIVEITTYLELTSFDTKNVPSRLRDFFFPCYQNLNLLNVFRVTGKACSMYSLEEIEKMMIRAITNMKHLQEFALHVYCTDEIVLTVVESCPNLHHFDATLSGNVTNRCIDFFIGCSKLKEIHLNHTSVQLAGYLRLLSSCENLIDIGKYSKMCSLLEALDDKKIKTSFNVDNFRGSGLETKHLVLLSKFFPKIKALDITLKSADMTALKVLNNLENLKVKSTNFWNIVRLLEKVGPSIRSMNFESITEVELISISCLCPNLKSLTLKQCNFSKRTIDKDSWGRYFSSVETLVCDKNVPLIHFEFLVANCPNVKVMLLPDVPNFKDEHLKNIISINPMQQLEELHINENNNSLTIKSFERILENCKKLNKIDGLKKCKSLTKKDLHKLKIRFPQLAHYFKVYWKSK